MRIDCLYCILCIILKRTTQIIKLTLNTFKEFSSIGCFYLSKHLYTLMKCCHMQHFIWVFTVCQSTCKPGIPNEKGQTTDVKMVLKGVENMKKNNASN